MAEKTFEEARAHRRGPLMLNHQNTSLVSQREPDMAGHGVAVWRVRIPEPEKRAGRWGSVLCMWFMHAPDVTPEWEYFMVVLTHLRHIEGWPDPQKAMPDAAYDFTMISLDPRFPLPIFSVLEAEVISEDKHGKIHVLNPSDFTAQFQDVGGDARALVIAERMLELVVSGQLLPDADYRVQWAHALMVCEQDARGIPIN